MKFVQLVFSFILCLTLNTQVSLARDIQYRHVFVPGVGDDAEKTCQAVRHELGKHFENKYGLENVLTSCQSFSDQVTQWAVIFTFDAANLEIDIPLDYLSEIITSDYQYVVERHQVFTRTESFVRWIGVWEWHTRDVPYTRIETATYSHPFSNRDECRAVASEWADGYREYPSKDVDFTACFLDEKAAWRFLIVYKLPESGPER